MCCTQPCVAMKNPLTANSMSTDADRSKFVLALIALAAATALLLLGRIGGDAWVTAMSWIVAAYMLGQPAAVLAAGWNTTRIAGQGDKP